MKQNDGSYKDTADTVERNNIDKVFHHGTKMTVSEAKAGSQEAEFFDKWVERNKGQVRDKRNVKSDGGNSGGSNTPSNSGGGDSGGERKSLFG